MRIKRNFGEGDNGGVSAVSSSATRSEIHVADDVFFTRSFLRRGTRADVKMFLQLRKSLKLGETERVPSDLPKRDVDDELEKPLLNPSCVYVITLEISFQFKLQRPRT